jgi:hypothetical protein
LEAGLDFGLTFIGDFILKRKALDKMSFFGKFNKEIISS